MEVMKYLVHAQETSKICNSKASRSISLKFENVGIDSLNGWVAEANDLYKAILNKKA